METARIYKPKRTLETRKFACMCLLGDRSEVAFIERENGEFNVVNRVVVNHYSTTLGELCGMLRGETSVICVAFDMYELLCKCDFYAHLSSGQWGTPQDGKGAMICESPPTIIDCVDANGCKIRFMDLANWGIRKQDVSSVPGTVDVYEIAEVFHDYLCMVQMLGMGTLQTTAASQAFNCYRKEHMHFEMLATGRPEIRQLERRAYHGGRAEAFRIGKLPGRIYHVDVKSMYSWLGETEYFPTALEKVINCGDLPSGIGDNCETIAIADCKVRTDVPMYPVQHNGILVYPVGTFVTTLAGNELTMALTQGHVVSVDLLATYLTAPIYRDWALWYYQACERIKSCGLGHLSNALKLAVNSSYGKIGARGRQWHEVDEPHHPKQWGQWWSEHPVLKTATQFRCVGSAIQYLDSGSEPPSSMPCISSCMTSAGRMCLFGLMMACGLDNVYYVDTDGIMTNRDGYDALIACGMMRDNVPGKLQLREVSDDVEVYGIKHYRFGKRYVCASIPEVGIDQTGKRPTWKQHKPFTYSLWHKNPFVHEFTTRSAPKPGAYRHGHVLRNGTVCPWVMELIKNHKRDENGQWVDEQTNSVLGYKDISPR